MITAVVPAAGLGTRLGSGGPKALVPFLGTTLFGRVVDALVDSVDQVVVVVRPGDEGRFVDEFARLHAKPTLTLAVQHVATGSADAVAIGLDASPRGAQCIVCWADQVGVDRDTVSAVRHGLEGSAPPLVLPVTELEHPYVWVEVDDVGVLSKVGRERDGDASPHVGLSDLGLFGIPRDAGLAILRNGIARSENARERDFVYLLPELAAQCGLELIRIKEPSQAIAVNTPEQLWRAEESLGESA